jgi:hypothetical protein
MSEGTPGDGKTVLVPEPPDPGRPAGTTAFMLDWPDRANMERATLRTGIAIAMVVVGAMQATLAGTENVPYAAFGVFYALLGVVYYWGEVHRDTGGR